MNKRRLIGVAITLVVVIGIGAWFVQRADANSAAPYRLAQVELGTVESTVTSTGRLTALQSVAVGTQVSGRVIGLFADYNDRVKEGQLIARIDPTIQLQSLRNAEANLERVRAALAQAERDFRRNQTLYEQQVITEAEFNQVEYSLTVARANLTSAEVSREQARQNLAYTEIYSPIDGVVVERNVEPGQTVAASLSAPQLYLLATDLKDIEILAGVDESDIGAIRNGMPVRFTVNAYPSTIFDGVVRQVRLASATQENVVNYTAVISVKNDELRLVPGMTAEVDFIVERAENVFMVPNAALRLRPSEEMIAQLTDSTMIAIAQGTGGRGAMMAMARANGALPNGAGGQGDRSARQRGQGALRAGGADVQPDAAPPGGVAGQGARAGGAGGGRGSRPGMGGAQSPGAPAAEEDAIVDDGVFVLGGGRPPTGAARVTFSPLWYIKDGTLGVLQVRTGISDQTVTEISAPGLEEGMEVVIGLTQPQTEGAGGTTNPFQQDRGGGGRGGGPVIRNFGGGFGG